MTEGILVLVNKKTLQVKFTNAKGREVSFNIKESELSTALLEKKKKAIAELNDLEVELEEVGGQPKKITEKGKEWQSFDAQPANQLKRKVVSIDKSAKQAQPTEEKQEQPTESKQEQANLPENQPAKHIITRIPQKVKKESDSPSKVLPPPSSKKEKPASIPSLKEELPSTPTSLEAEVSLEEELFSTPTTLEAEVSLEEELSSTPTSLEAEVSLEEELPSTPTSLEAEVSE